MTTNNNLPINSLVFEEIRNNLISYLLELKNQNNVPIYQDYNFQSSGISTLLNLLSYHTHYIGYYVKMLLNETSIDTINRYESMFSKAKLTRICT